MAKAKIKLTSLEYRIMNSLWEHGKLPIREIQELYPGKKRPAYTTIQTMVYRLEGKGAVKRVKKIGNAHIFEATLSPEEARSRYLDEVIGIFGGSVKNLMSQLVKSKQISKDDINYLQTALSDGESSGPVAKENKSSSSKTLRK